MGDPDWVGEVVPQAVLDMVLDREEVGVREAQVLGEEEGDMGVAAAALTVAKAPFPETVAVVEKELEAEAVEERVSWEEAVGVAVMVGSKSVPVGVVEEVTLPVTEIVEEEEVVEVPVEVGHVEED